MPLQFLFAGEHPREPCFETNPQRLASGVPAAGLGAAFKSLAGTNAFADALLSTPHARTQRHAGTRPIKFERISAVPP
jgi:hypothetical protein